MAVRTPPQITCTTLEWPCCDWAGTSSTLSATRWGVGLLPHLQVLIPAARLHVFCVAGELNASALHMLLPPVAAAGSLAGTIPTKVKRLVILEITGQGGIQPESVPDELSRSLNVLADKHGLGEVVAAAAAAGDPRKQFEAAVAAARTPAVMRGGDPKQARHCPYRPLISNLNVWVHLNA